MVWELGYQVKRHVFREFECEEKFHMVWEFGLQVKHPVFR